MIPRDRRRVRWCFGIALAVGLVGPARGEDGSLAREAAQALRRAVSYYRTRVASHGGYVYYYAADLGRRWGEGEATADQVFVQHPGTPRVGQAYLAAYLATDSREDLDAARETAGSLIDGQLKSGGWAQVIDFDPNGKKVGAYRNGRGRGRIYSTLDDGITQAAIRFLASLDVALDQKDARLHEAVTFALDALRKAQFPNGGFPQVWTGPVEARPVVPARYPEYDWRTEGKVDAYWNHYTLNDGLAGTVADTLLDAYYLYQDDRNRAALVKLGDFLLLAQMPDPQPAWAQQYDDQMRPAWARKFEPPAVTGGESQDVLEALLRIYQATGDPKYLRPFPKALEYLKRSRLPDGRLARFYELKTNRPLYMTRKDGVYSLTYDDADLPNHYGWKVVSRLARIERDYQTLRDGGRPSPRFSAPLPAEKVRAIVRALDGEGRWVSVYDGERLVGQPKFERGFRYLSSEVFASHVEALSAYLVSVPAGPVRGLGGVRARE